MKLYSLGAAGEVGRSAFFLEGEETTLLFDYGVKVFTKEEKPAYPAPLPRVPDGVFITHAHLDHSGYLPRLFDEEKVRWYATPPTVDIAEILWNDSLKLAKLKGHDFPYKKTSIEKAKNYWIPAIHGQILRVGEFSIKIMDAGHLAGATMLRVESKGKSVLYTGDFKIEETELHKGAKIPEDADVLIIESTYYDREHPNRKELEKQLMQEIWETIENGGNVLLPAFAVGRTQEIIRIIRKYEKEIPVYVDGMGTSVNKVYLKYPGYIKDFPGFEKSIESVNMVASARERGKATKHPSIIVATAGMLEGGPALGYLKSLLPNSKIIFTGYSVEGTNGWRLLNYGKIKVDEYELDVGLPAEYLDFSAHAGREDLYKMIRSINPELVVCVHGDAPENFAKEIEEKEGIKAVAPKFGEVLSL
ncbi:MAG: MBL fold metallo-hydrolase [Candidatus Anstonellales archaeon]